MRINTFPYATIFISSITFIYSSYVAFNISGSFFSNLNIQQLEAYGGFTWTHLKKFELWRLVASQLIHVKYMHMFYNAFSLFALGLLLEPYLRPTKFLLLWFVSGSLGTLVSTFFGTPPWNLGTGASQAVLGLAAFGLILSLKKMNTSKWLWAVLAFTLLPAFVLDFISVGYPKPGHLFSALIGLVAGAALNIKSQSRLYPY